MTAKSFSFAPLHVSSLPPRNAPHLLRNCDRLMLFLGHRATAARRALRGACRAYSRLCAALLCVRHGARGAGIRLPAVRQHHRQLARQRSRLRNLRRPPPACCSIYSMAGCSVCCSRTSGSSSWARSLTCRRFSGTSSSAPGSSSTSGGPAQVGCEQPVAP